MALNLNGRDYTPEKITDLFINGWYFHSDEAKAVELHELTAGAEPVSRHIFLDYLLEATSHATYVGSVVREALHHDLVDEAA